MVTQRQQKQPHKRKACEYSLDAVHRAALAQQVYYRSRKVQNDIENLEYPLAVVCRCLRSLKPQHYHESVYHHDEEGWFDVYKCDWPASPSKSGGLDPLYIKLKLNRDRNLIILASFHLTS